MGTKAVNLIKLEKDNVVRLAVSANGKVGGKNAVKIFGKIVAFEIPEGVIASEVSKHWSSFEITYLFFLA